MTVLGVSLNATPMRGPQLSFTGGGEKKGLPDTTTLLKWASLVKSQGMAVLLQAGVVCGVKSGAPSGIHGAFWATLQSGGMAVAPMIHCWWKRSKAFHRRPSSVCGWVK